MEPTFDALLVQARAALARGDHGLARRLAAACRPAINGPHDAAAAEDLLHALRPDPFAIAAGLAMAIVLAGAWLYALG